MKLSSTPNRSSPLHRLSAALLCVAAGLAHAQPGTPTYSLSTTDAVTGDNSFISGGFRYYTIDAGADRYQSNLYERPVAGGFNLIGTAYAAEEYYGFVDITSARFGFDNRYLYVSIDLFDRNKSTKDGVNDIIGLDAKYAVRFSTDADGRNGYYLRVDSPQFAAIPNTVFTNLKTEGWRDTDQDVGGKGGPIHGQPGPSGRDVTKIDNPIEEFGLNGWDQQIIYSDGFLDAGGPPVMWQRVNPADNTVVEFAVDYLAIGLTRTYLENLRSLEVEAVFGSPSGPELGLWNDAFTGIEAGSPNLGIGTDNEFGTQGLGNINGADTARFNISAACAADLTGDGFVDDADFVIFAAAYELFTVPPADTNADLNLDGFIDDADFTLFAAAYEAFTCR